MYNVEKTSIWLASCFYNEDKKIIKYSLTPRLKSIALFYILNNTSRVHNDFYDAVLGYSKKPKNFNSYSWQNSYDTSLFWLIGNVFAFKSNTKFPFPFCYDLKPVKLRPFNLQKWCFRRMWLCENNDFNLKTND